MEGSVNLTVGIASSSSVFQFSVYRHMVTTTSWLFVGECGHVFSLGWRIISKDRCMLILGTVYKCLYDVYQGSPSTRTIGNVWNRAFSEDLSSWVIKMSKTILLILSGQGEWARKKPLLVWAWSFEFFFCKYILDHSDWCKVLTSAERSRKMKIEKKSIGFRKMAIRRAWWKWKSD